MTGKAQYRLYLTDTPITCITLSILFSCARMRKFVHGRVTKRSRKSHILQEGCQENGYLDSVVFLAEIAGGLICLSDGFCGVYSSIVNTTESIGGSKAIGSMTVPASLRVDALKGRRSDNVEDVIPT